jgi:hypothetical protein
MNKVSDRINQRKCCAVTQSKLTILVMHSIPRCAYKDWGQGDEGFDGSPSSRRMRHDLSTSLRDKSDENTLNPRSLGFRRSLGLIAAHFDLGAYYFLISKYSFSLTLTHGTVLVSTVDSSNGEQK